jgi:Family of unknown function (DUF6580)
MLTGIILVALAVLLRFSSDTFGTWNLVPMGAIALYAGAKLPRRWAWLVPVAGMILSDVVIDYGRGRSFNELWRWVGYGALGATALFGPLARVQKLGILRYPLLSLGASTLFFLASNAAVWVGDHGQYYAPTAAGLIACYVAGLPFYARTILADLAGTAVFFGVGPVVERAANRIGLIPLKKPVAEGDVAS